MSESKMDYSYQSVPSSFEDFEKEDRFYGEMCRRLDAYIERAERFPFWFLLVLWMVCPGIVLISLLDFTWMDMADPVLG